MTANARGKAQLAALVVAGAALVSACGGSSDNGGGSPVVVTPSVTEKVPDSASTSASGFVLYLQQLVVAFADLLEPVDTSTVTAPPADETSEPSLTI